MEGANKLETITAAPENVSDEAGATLEAERIFLLMKKEYRLSRNTRAHWYFSHLNSEIKVTNKQSLSEFTGDLDVVSVVPCEPFPPDWDWDTGHLYTYQVDSQSMVTFLSQQYRFVYLLDFSPSAACTDIKKGTVLLDQQVKALRRSLEGVIRPFYVPGSQLLFKPDIYVTVIAWTPFLCSGAQAVLHQGWLLTPLNLDLFMKGIVSGLSRLEEHISRIAAFVIDELETIKIQSERIMGALFEESMTTVPLVPSIPMAAPDTGFVNMIQTGMLALQLLPENSSGGLIVITDGVINIPDINTLDTLLNHLRTKTTCLSFLQVSSSYHPHTGLGYCPNNELMEFMSLATSGAYLPRAPEIEPSEPYLYEMNIYHEAFLAWSFRKCLEGVKLSQPMPIIASDKDLFRKGRYTEINNPFFIAASEEKLIEKKRLEMNVNTNLTSILSCRLREGYTVNTVTHKDNEMKVKLTLPWKHHTFIHYTVMSWWPPGNNPEWSKCKVEVSIEGPYDILHDIICQKDKQFPSHFRMSVIKKFYSTLNHLQQTDILLVHLHSFTTNPAHYTIPDPVRNGLPLFVINPGNTTPVLYSSDFSHPLFATFWKPVSSLDINIWHRWMHTHRIGLMLQHDHPLPKHLLTTSSNGRYHPVQCRKAASKVSELLKNWAEFCLLENHSYIRFIRDENDQPTSFYVIRVTSKPPCVVVWLAFLGGIPGSVRHGIFHELKEKIQALTITQRVCWKDLPITRIKPLESSSSSEEDESSSDAGAKPMVSSPFSEVFSCVPMSKPVEKILIRYEKMPEDFCSVLGFFPSRSDSPVGFRTNETLQRNKNRNASAAFLTLSRYVSHQRWIWSIQSCANVSVSSQAIARILNTLCKLRLHEGFTFAHSSNGIQNMVLEVPMEQEDEAGDAEEKTPQTCVLQYIIFPPHTTSSSIEDSMSDDEHENSDSVNDMTEADGEVQIITEIWTEPQDGHVDDKDSEWNFLSGLDQRDIAPKFFPRDLECISTLITFEHLCLMCQNPCVPSPPGSSLQTDLPYVNIQTVNTTKEGNSPRIMPLTSNTNIQHIPFAFDLMSLLPKSHQTELLFSLLIQDLSPSLLGSTYDWFPGQEHPADAPNEMLFEQLVAEFERISDREVDLSARDHKMIPELIRNRQTANYRFPSQSSHKSPSHQSHSFSSATTGTGRAGPSFSKRNPSGTSVTSSSNDTRDSFNLGLGEHVGIDLYASDPKWKCFVKAVSPTHLVLTIMPASFKDLKSLTLSEESISNSATNFVNVISKPIASEEEQENLDSFSINSSISNLEIFSGELPSFSSDGRNSFSEATSKRQRSGSDVFEMTRPKPPSVRKTSGDASVMRDRTASLDGYSQFKAKAILKNLTQVKETNDRNRCRSMDSKPLSEEPSKCSTPNDKKSKRTSGSKSTAETGIPCSTPKSPWPHLTSPIPAKFGSVALPIYVYDCNIAGLTNSLLFKNKVDKPKNFYQDHLFQPEIKEKTSTSSFVPKELSEQRDEDQKTPEPNPPKYNTCDHHEITGHIDKEIKQRCHIIQMTYFKTYVQVLFRSLQLGLPIHSYDVQHSMDYCDNEGSLELDLDGYIKAVCPHKDVTTQLRLEDTVTKDMDIHDIDLRSISVLDTDRLKSSKSCVKLDPVHKETQNKFLEILNGQFKMVPSHPDLFFFCPPGLDIGVIENDSGRKRNETRSSEGTSKNMHSGSSGKLKVDEDDDRTIEFRSEMSEYSVKLRKADSGTDADTCAQDGHSNMSVLSNLETVSDMENDDDDEESVEYSPPLFVQFSLSISQENEDIVCTPVKYLPTCLAEILQDQSIPDPEQELDMEALGLRLDLVCMTLPKQLESLTENLGGLRSTSLCSSTSFRDSTSIPDDDNQSCISIEEDLNSGSDILSHLPEYQHRAVTSVLDEMKWMLRDEIAFALTKTMPLSHQTLEFVKNHVQSSVGKAGSLVETIDLNFVFGTEKSLEKFKENFQKMELHGFLLREDNGFYYLDIKPCDSEAETDFRNRDENLSGSRRKYNRHSRHLQLSPVKEAAAPANSIDEPNHAVQDSIVDSTDASDVADLHNVDDDFNNPSEKSNFITNLSCIFQVDQERVHMYLHLRDNNTQVRSIWKTVHHEIVAAIKTICTQVNQCLLLHDLYDTRLCNRLLEPECNEDIFRDPSRHQDDFDESPYLEANLNMKFAPGKFQCPEVWETKFYLHPRLKQGQGHNSQSRGLQALKNILSVYLVTNRTNMFVYKDDNKNIFYLKMSETIQSGYCSTVVSRQSSIVPHDDQSWSRTSSIGNSKHLNKKDSMEDSGSGQVYSRSNSVGESDKKCNDDFIILKVFGIHPAGKNIREDLIAVLQKKLDDKVVEVISMMLQRNSRCKLASEDVMFLQKPNSAPDTVLQFTVHVNTIQYLQAVAYYLRQNMVQIPLIAPNYTAGSCQKFRDFGDNLDLSSIERTYLDNDVFLYNDSNPRGGHKGIGCIALSIVDGRGNLVKHFSYPKPTASDSEHFPNLSSQSSLKEMIESQVFTESIEDGSRSPGPMALIQFRIWESGRVDFEKLTGLLQCSIKHALWDAILEYKMLTAPLAVKDPSDDLADAMTDVSTEDDTQVVSPTKEFTAKSILQSLSEATGAVTNSSSAAIEIKERRDTSMPEIVIEANDLVETPLAPKTTSFEKGHRGVLHFMYSSSIFNWLDLGLEIEAPSMYKHSIQLVATNSLPLILKEIETQINSIIPDLQTRIFQGRNVEGSKDPVFLPYKKNHKDPSCNFLNAEDFILVSRNIDHWKVGTREEFVDPLLMKNKTVKACQNFHPLILLPVMPGIDSGQAFSPPTLGLMSTPNNSGIAHLPATPITPVTPAFGSSGLSGMLQTIQTTNQVFVPRQRLILARVSKKHICFYFYNLSKDCLDRMVKQTSNLGQWFTARTSLMSSIVSQKLGLFHNLHFFRPESKTNNPYIGNVSNVDALVRHHAPPTSQSSGGKTSQSQSLVFKDVYKNSIPTVPLHKMAFSVDKDALGKHGRQMLNVWSSEQREYHRKLYILWQSRGENCNSVYDDNLINYFKSKARLLHYVFTPMLFLPKWRWQANATRDHAAAEFPIMMDENKRNSTAHILEIKLRHGSGSSLRSDKKTSAGPGANNSPNVNRSPTGSPKPLRANQNERFHDDLLTNYFQEYVQYLQTLGFMLIDIKANVSKRSKSNLDKTPEESVARRRHGTGKVTKPQCKTMYLQKSLLGGILIFEIGISEPFFYSKLHALEASRIQLRTNQSLTGKNFVSTFLDECDRIKVLIHLHSFTYDYHLRTIQSHIAQKPSNLRKGFHIISFLEDFMKYYSKGPNFARNFVHTGAIEIPTQSVSPVQLFNYLLSHEKQYGMTVIRMEPVIIDPNTEFDNEYVLIKLSQHRVTFKDPQDVRRTDDFDVSLILSYDTCPIGMPEKDKDILRLKYFVIMTSKRELYPMYGVEKKLGKFKTVSTSQSLKILQKIATPKYPPSRPPTSAPGATPENGLASVLPVLTITEENSTTTTRETTPDQELEGSSMKSHILGLERLSWTVQFRFKEADQAEHFERDCNYLSTLHSTYLTTACPAIYPHPGVRLSA